MNDHLIRILTSDGSLRAVAALTTNLAEETRHRQQTDPTATVAIGRVVTAAALLGSLLKGAQRLALILEGNGPLRQLSAESDAHGNLRATLKEPVAGLPPKEDRFDVAGAIGRAGFLQVVKDLGLREPYRGMVQLVASEVAEDLAWYLTHSEQVPSSVGLGVTLGPEAEVKAAGGFLVQAMPGCDEELLARVEERVRLLPPVSTLLARGESPEQIVARLFAGIPYTVQLRTELAYRCTCRREQVRAMLATLDPEELQELAAAGEEVTVTCEFCKEPYRFSAAEVGELAGS
ncbi:Hsp33 family molecular chaperone HslO [Desulfuromonas carbonis]|uniref:Hsp33 family molecular chaperone HslO n=1 Tax=Desulfuromonas sp. DDH964 TaxID=1823759 RepID=UPI00078CCD49|nr:Hsp33 family molecular chaperone HslO [Desulfuromonas sp. DDH964]AMV73848.1 Hsp33-like chaperonin [Desulfuromonas sp. DDH964]